MRITGNIPVAVDRATAFDIIANPRRLAQCIPGCSEVREIAPAHYAAKLTNTLGFITVSFNVNVELLTVDPPNVIEAKITGDAIALAGRVAATGAFRLSDAADGTIIHYVADIALTGKLGGLGEPVFRATSARMARLFEANLKNAIESPMPETPA